MIIQIVELCLLLLLVDHLIILLTLRGSTGTGSQQITKEVSWRKQYFVIPHPTTSDQCSVTSLHRGAAAAPHTDYVIWTVHIHLQLAAQQPHSYVLNAHPFQSLVIHPSMYVYLPWTGHGPSPCPLISPLHSPSCSALDQSLASSALL